MDNSAKLWTNAAQVLSCGFAALAASDFLHLLWCWLMDFSASIGNGFLVYCYFIMMLPEFVVSIVEGEADVMNVGVLAWRSWIFLIGLLLWLHHGWFPLKVTTLSFPGICVAILFY